MQRYRALLKPALAFDLTRYPYLKDIYADDSDELVLMKAGQMGISEYLLSWLLWNADVNTLTGLYVFPNDTHVSDFSRARLGPAIEPGVSNYLAGIVVGAADPDTRRRGADAVKLKRVRDRFVYFRGAKVSPTGRAPQLKSVDADALVLDEYDEMDSRAPDIARERLGNSLRKQVRLASTPTYANTGIHREYMASDQRHWHVKCPGCGNWQTPDLADVLLESDALERPTRWHEKDGVPFVACRKCSGALETAGTYGKWVAAYPARPIRGYHVHGLLSTRRTLQEIIGTREGNKATGLQSTDESTRKETINQKIGLPYKPSSAVSLTDEALDNCRREYTLGAKTGPAFCGIDVGRVYHVIIRGAEWDLRYAGAFADVADIIPLLQEHHVEVTTMDALPETHEARKFQAARGAGRVWLAYYRERDKNLPPAAWDVDDRSVTADRTRTLDAMLGLFRKAAQKESGATLPANARDIPDYYAHLKALERKLQTDSMGNTVAVYVQHGADHFAHAENYAYLAAMYWMYAAERTEDQVIYAPVRIGNW